jgi:outer membrane protein assembly factor BamA
MYKIYIVNIIKALLLLTIAAFFLQSCHPARHVPSDKKLLSSVKIKNENTDIDSDELESTLKQKPNRKTLGFYRFHLSLYNIVHPKKDKENWRTKIANVIGEPPVIFDTTLIKKSASTMEYLLTYKGYYNAEIETKIKEKKRSVKVIYKVNTGKSHTIHKVNYDILDPNIRDIVVADSSNSLIKKGDNIDIDAFDDERSKLVKLMKKNGYYNFSINNVHFYADTNNNSYKGDVTIAIRHSFDSDNVDENRPFTKYRINKIYVYTQFDPKRNLEEGKYYRDSVLTEELIEGINFRFLNKQRINPIVFLQSNFIQPGDYYNIENIEKTHRHLASLGQFRLININLKVDSTNLGNNEQYLVCNIYLTPFTKQNYNAEIEGTNTSGNLGGGAGLAYFNRNLFRGAENLSVKTSLSLQTMRDARELDKRFLNTLEASGEVKLDLPQLWPSNLFKRNDKFIKEHNPKTQLSIATSFQKRPDFARLLNVANIGYYWNSGERSQYSHIVNPVEFYLVKLTDTIDGFSNNFNDYIKKSYEDQFISVFSYKLTYSGQNINKLKNFLYLSYNIETAGNLLEGIKEVSNAEPVDGSYQILGLNFSQFVKTDFDIRFYQNFNQSHSLVYRAYFGIGVPYGNSKASGLPFIKKYYTGGANDIRAYQVRMVGPGSYSSSSIINNVADMKLLFNLEYRFDIMKYVEGALFLDSGNIWAINMKSEQPGADFSFDRFYKELALGTGVGLRLDISFIVIRFDFGIPLYDPSLPEADRWLKTFSPLQWNDLTFNFGIGYPF